MSNKVKANPQSHTSHLYPQSSINQITLQTDYRHPGEVSNQSPEEAGEPATREQQSISVSAFLANI